MPKGGGKKSKKAKKKAKQKAQALPPPKTIQERSREYIDHSITAVAADACSVGANARGIKPTGVNMIKESIEETGYSPGVDHPSHTREGQTVSIWSSMACTAYPR